MEPIDWALAQRIAARVGGTNEFAKSYLAHSLDDDFAELTEQAEQLVGESTGLHSTSGAARARVVSRGEWVGVNLASFKRQLAPVTERMSKQMSGVFAPSARAVAGAEIGTLLGWMSQRVLGQYDLLVADDNPDEGDTVYYVGSNVLAIEKRHAFPPREFRLWLALHEVTHRAQFTGVPWMREHYLRLVKVTMGSLEPDPKRFLEALRRAVSEVRAGRNPIADGGIVALLAGNEQRAAMDEIAGMMSLLEGHGDVTMNRAGLGHVPSAERFARVLSQRRGEVKGVAKAVRTLLGVEAKMRQYEEGEQFIAHIEKVHGERFIDHAWVGSTSLPTIAEIRDPDRWIERVRGVGAVAR
jgi:coenzyme F420 biosynthesis associated uncharacterized protein